MTTTSTITVTEASSQVRIRLRSTSDDLQLPVDIGAILVGTDVRRYQLSTLVNKLLETDRPVPLEFLIKGQFLRTTLEEFLTQNGISAETTLDIEYVRALIPPLSAASFASNDDWLSSVDILSNSARVSSIQNGHTTSNQPPRIVTGSFDGTIKVWDTSGNVIATTSGHTAGSVPVSCKAVHFIAPNQILSAGNDRTIKLWDYADAVAADEQGSLTPKLEFYGHTNAVENIAYNAREQRIFSASLDHKVGVWSTDVAASSPEASAELLPRTENRNKRQKLSRREDDIAKRGPLALMSGHQSPVTAVCLDEQENTFGYSASLDHTIKTWDLVMHKCVDTRVTSHSLLSLAHLPDWSLLAAGSSNNQVLLVDPRTGANKLVTATLKGHSNSVVSLVRDPNSTYQILSGSYDGSCRIWDLRSTRNDMDGKVTDAVYVIKRDSSNGEDRIAGDGVKVFDVAWDKEVGIVSVGEDKMVQINKS